MIKVSDYAKSKAIQLMTEDGFNPETDFIRVGVKSGGCSGLEYVLKFDNQQNDTDHVFEDNGIKILVDKKSILYLAGTTFRVFWRIEWKRICVQQPKRKQNLWMWGKF